MFHRILVPLDGSRRAEQALPIAARLARMSGGSILLLQVCTSTLDFTWAAMEPTISSLEETLKVERAYATRYLARIANADVLEGIGTVTLITEGAPASRILAEARDYEADVIVMCSHGYTSLARWFLGSVAQKVAYHSSIPVLILREGTGLLHPEDPHSARVMVPLDGSPLAEKALLPAAYLSAALSTPLPAELSLVQLLPRNRNSVQDVPQQEMATGEQRMESTEAVAYLKHVAQSLREGELADVPLRISTFVAVAADIASMIVGTAEGDTQIAQDRDGAICDVIAMATRGRSGFQRWLLGSVTEHVLAATHLPLFMISVSPAAESEQKAASRFEKRKAEILTSWVGLL